MHNAVEEYVLQNPVKMCIGIAITIGVCVCMTTKGIYLSVLHFMLYICVYEFETSGSHSRNIAYDLHYGGFSLVSFKNSPYRLDYCK